MFLAIYETAPLVSKTVSILSLCITRNKYTTIGHICKLCKQKWILIYPHIYTFNGRYKFMTGNSSPHVAMKWNGLPSSNSPVQSRLYNSWQNVHPSALPQHNDHVRIMLIVHDSMSKSTYAANDCPLSTVLVRPLTQSLAQMGRVRVTKSVFPFFKLN